MRSTFGRLVSRSALLAALGFGGFGGIYGATAQPADVPQAADWTWLTVVPEGPENIVEPVADETSGPADESVSGRAEDWTWL
jgi:hypothetical protein